VLGVRYGLSLEWPAITIQQLPTRVPLLQPDSLATEFSRWIVLEYAINRSYYTRRISLESHWLSINNNSCMINGITESATEIFLIVGDEYVIVFATVF